MIPASSCGVRGGERLERLRPGGHALLGAGRPVGEDLLGEHVGEHRVHAAHRVAHAHAAERVAVVAAADGQHPGPLGAADAALVLQHHLQRDLDADRAGVGEEDVLEPGRAELDQPLREPDRGLVGEPAEHHVGELGGLRGERRVEGRVAVAVDRRPPRRHPVDQLGAVREPQPDAGGPGRPAGSAPGRSSRCRGATRARGRTRAGPGRRGRRRGSSRWQSTSGDARADRPVRRTFHEPTSAPRPRSGPLMSGA